MAYDFNLLKKNLAEKNSRLSNEYGNIRTGRVTPALLDTVLVESYGSMVPISQVATVSIEDPKTLRIVPWDVSNLKVIEKALLISNLGVSVSLDDKGARAIFPALTTESRSNFVKIAKEKLEEAKISVRKERNRVNEDLQKKKKEGSLSEDEMNRHKIEMEKIIKESIEALDLLFKKKEKEIMS